MRQNIYCLLAIAHYFQIEQRALQDAANLPVNTLSLWKFGKRTPEEGRFEAAQCALVDLAGLPDRYKEMDIQKMAKRLIK
jgi:hypothetical protein